MGPWSKVEKRIRDLSDPQLKLRFYFTSYRQEKIATPHWTESAGKLWVSLNGKTLWAIPKDRHSGDQGDIGMQARRSPGWLVEMMVEYMDVPRDDLLTWTPSWSTWGLIDILLASDRRIGRRQWPALETRLVEPAAKFILAIRKYPASEMDNHVLYGRTSDTLHDPD
ncbi:MAG: hypothetical protein ACREO1_03355 [Arenimonas sp.]